MGSRAIVLCALAACAADPAPSENVPRTVSDTPDVRVPDAAPVARTEPAPPPPHDFLPGLAALTCAAPEGAFVGFCERAAKVTHRFHERWMELANAFFAPIRPDDLPDTVVYPFAGGDLTTALTVFPDAREITTASLEPAGDPRTLGTLKQAKLVAALDVAGDELEHLYRSKFSNTTDLRDSTTEGDLPTQLVLSLTALRVHGFEPVWIRYFKLEPDGAIDYMSDDDLGAEPGVREIHTRERNHAFGDVEIAYRRPGETGQRIYRHLQGNLRDEELAKDDRVLRHLDAKGDIAAMTKAASYLLTWSEFGRMRDYLLAHATWIVSDATGPLPSDARRAGFTYDTYGEFVGAHMDAGREADEEWPAIFDDQPKRRLRFQFGYPDRDGNAHLIVYQR